MNKFELREIIIDQNNRREPEDLIHREISEEVESNVKNNFIIVLSGIRRCGKSTLLNQIRKKHPGYYLNFDDERLINFKVEDFQTLYEVLIELYGERRIFYFDEIQNISNWERFVRRLHDEGKKVFITGSNASILSKELGTHLTGRHLNLELLPFSFREFLSFKRFELTKEKIYETNGKAAIKKYFEEFLLNGGFPDYLREYNQEFLKTLYENIIYRDIIVRYGLPNHKTLKEMVYLAVNNISKEISFNSIRKTLGMGSSTTVKEYFDYLQNSFLVFLVPVFDYSLKKQIYLNKKIYCIDNGLAKHLGFRFTSDYGKLLENLVYLNLRRRDKEIYYYTDKRECDFVLRQSGAINEAIQVCFELDEENKSREITGLIDAMKKFRLKEGMILTYDQEDELNIENRKIRITPVWKLLLNAT